MPAATEHLISIVIPLFNEVESLPKLIENIQTVGAQSSLQYEIIFVDDGSTDGSTALLRDFSTDPAIKTVELRRNFGKSAALAAGFAVARGEIIVTMDADLQDDPAEIPNLLAKLDEGCDLVTGWKANRQDPLTKTIPSFIANTTTRLVSGVKIKDMNSGLKCYRSEVAKSLNLYGDLHRYIPIIAHYQGFRVAEIPVRHHARQYGRSKYGVSRLLRGLMDFFTVIFIYNYGSRPLHLLGGLGALLGGLGLLINLYMTWLWIRGVRPIGDRPLLLLGILLVVVGVQITTLGLIAELLVANSRRQENPLDIVREIHQ